MPHVHTQTHACSQVYFGSQVQGFQSIVRWPQGRKGMVKSLVQESCPYHHSQEAEKGGAREGDTPFQVASSVATSHHPPYLLAASQLCDHRGTDPLVSVAPPRSSPFPNTQGFG